MLEINQYIDPEYLPEGGCTIDGFPELNLPPRAGWMTYYDLLKQEQQKNGGGQKLTKIIVAMSEGKSQTDDGDFVPDHSTWEEFEELSDAEKKLLRSQTEHILKEIAEQIEKSCGTVPGEFSGILNRIRTKEPAKFDWKSYLRRFAGGSQIVFTKKLRRKHNKRFEENPGLKIKQKRHVLVAIDTSGSVSDKELKEFLNEIDHINKTGSEITIIQCDTTITFIGKYKAGDEFEIHGRGGTDFDPVLEYYNNNIGRYSCLVYLTDGECNTDIKPRGKMLWVISTRGSVNDSLPGPQIKLN